MPIRIRKQGRRGLSISKPFSSVNKEKTYRMAPETAPQPWFLEPGDASRFTFFVIDKETGRWKRLPKYKLTSRIGLNGNALHVLEKRYLSKDKKGKVIDTPETLFRRVAKVIASAELKYNPNANVEAAAGEFYETMASLEFLPNSPALLNSNRGSGQLFAATVLQVEDSLESAFEIVKETALIHKGGGGTSFSLSKMRPEGDCVGDKSNVAGGPVPFIGILSAAAEYIRQGGIRKGCNSAVLDVTHPDIIKYIMAKDDPSVYSNFYTSVSVTDKFMEAVKKEEDYDLINPCNGEKCGRLNAKDVFDRLITQAWKTGDPGIVFADRINEDNTTPNLGRLEIISGCGEQSLLPYETCMLGSINLTKMVKIDKDKAEVDYAKLKRTVQVAVRCLDNLIDVSTYPLEKIEEASKRTRKIGLGVMGFADMLISLGISYNSEKALKTAEKIMGFIQKEAHKKSAILAEKRGAFPAYEGSTFDKNGKPKMRNAACTTIAPTGTLSLIAGVSGGIEPSFAVVFVRNILDGEYMLEVNPYFEEAAKRTGIYKPGLFKDLVSHNRLHSVDCIPQDLKDLFVTAHRITPEWHIKIQAAFQKYTDNAVSKTVNFPQEATREDMAKVFMMAYENGLKGTTVYRDGSRALQPLCTGSTGLALVDRYFQCQTCGNK